MERTKRITTLEHTSIFDNQASLTGNKINLFPLSIIATFTHFLALSHVLSSLLLALYSLIEIPKDPDSKIDSLKLQHLLSTEYGYVVRSGFISRRYHRERVFVRIEEVKGQRRNSIIFDVQQVAYITAQPLERSAPFLPALALAPASAIERRAI